MAQKKLLLIVNPQAGQKRIHRKLMDVVIKFGQSGFITTVMPTEAAGHARELAREYASNFDVVVCAGGDGTLNETVSGVMENDANVPIGYLPCGTTNDLASTLGLSRDLDTAAKDICDGNLFPLDIGSFNGRHFVYTASFGAFTRVSYSTRQTTKNLLGHLAYFMEGIKDLRQIQPVFARIHTEIGDFSGDYLFGAVSNTTSLAGILTLDKEIVMLNDGKFELLLVDMPRNALEISQLLINITQRRYEGMIHLVSASKIEIETPEPLEWTLDGEYEKGGTRFEIENRHSAISIIAPAVRNEQLE